MTNGSQQESSTNFRHLGLERPKRPKTYCSQTIIRLEGEVISHEPMTVDDLFPTFLKKANWDDFSSDHGKEEQNGNVTFKPMTGFLLPHLPKGEIKLRSWKSDISKVKEKEPEIKEEDLPMRIQLKPVHKMTPEIENESDDNGEAVDNMNPGLVSSNPFIIAEQAKPRRSEKGSAGLSIKTLLYQPIKETDGKKQEIQEPNRAMIQSERRIPINNDALPFTTEEALNVLTPEPKSFKSMPLIELENNNDLIDLEKSTTETVCHSDLNSYSYHKVETETKLSGRHIASENGISEINKSVSVTFDEDSPNKDNLLCQPRTAKTDNHLDKMQKVGPSSKTNNKLDKAIAPKSSSPSHSMQNSQKNCKTTYLASTENQELRESDWIPAINSLKAMAPNKSTNPFLSSSTSLSTDDSSKHIEEGGKYLGSSTSSDSLQVSSGSNDTYENANFLKVKASENPTEFSVPLELTLDQDAMQQSSTPTFRTVLAIKPRSLHL